MTTNSDHPGEFPFEAFIRRRYHEVRARRRFDLSSIFQLAFLIVILGFVTLALMMVIAVLTLVLVISPVMVLMSVIAKQMPGRNDRFEGDYGPYSREERYERHTVIDVTPERK